jgi:hypothetical protein
LAGSRSEDGIWVGRLVFFLEHEVHEYQGEDTLRFEALEFEEIAAQATALSVDELTRRLSKVLAARKV